MQELLALLCLQNARLGRTELTTTMEAALRIQAEIDSTGNKFKYGFIPSYKSTKETMHGFSKTDVTETARLTVPGPSGSHEDNSARAQLKAMAMKLIIDVYDHKDKMQAILEVPDISQEVKTKVEEALRELRTVSSDRGTMETYVNKLGESEWTSMTSTVPQKKACPIMTLDAVRIALKRIDHVEDAIRPTTISSKGDYKRIPYKTLLQNNRKKCWICGANHFAKDNPDCIQKLIEKRKNREPFEKISTTAMNRTTSLGSNQTIDEPLSINP